nr:hypothetical protein [Bradyrhizobium genosp. L]
MRRRFKQIQSLEERLAREAMRLRAEARRLPPGAEREKLLRRARQDENGLADKRLAARPGLRAPQ